MGIRTSLADALFTQTQQRVLGLFFAQPDRSFTLSELIRLAATGSGAVQREVRRLVESGLVTHEVLHGAKLLRANRDAPIFKELKGIIDKTSGVAQQLSACLAPLAARIDAAILYGSFAKGTSTASSDIDVLVVSDDLTLEELFKAFEGVENRTSRKVSPTLYSRAEFEKRRASKNAFVKKILDGAHVALIGNARVDRKARQPGARRKAQT